MCESEHGTDTENEIRCGRRSDKTSEGEIKARKGQTESGWLWGLECVSTGNRLVERDPVPCKNRT